MKKLIVLLLLGCSYESPTKSPDVNLEPQRPVVIKGYGEQDEKAWRIYRIVRQAKDSTKVSEVVRISQQSKGD